MLLRLFYVIHAPRQTGGLSPGTQIVSRRIPQKLPGPGAFRGRGYSYEDFERDSGRDRALNAELRSFIH